MTIQNYKSAFLQYLILFFVSLSHLTQSATTSSGKTKKQNFKHANIFSNLENDPGNCTQEMFQIKNNNGQTLAYDKAAFFSCQAQYALQRNWYPDPIGGLFSYQTWNGMDGFWQNGLAIEAMTNAMVYGNHSRYISVVKTSLRELSDLLLAYYPQPSFDDMAWYALAYTRVYEVDKTAKDFFRVAKDIYGWIWKQGWDVTVCGGGVWFDSGLTGKETIENAQVFQLALKLARLQEELEESTASANNEFDKDSSMMSTSYLHQAQLVWTFIQRTELIDSKTFQVYDGIMLDTCKAVKNVSNTHTYNSGVIVGGLIELSKIKGHQNSIVLAHNISSSVLKYMTKSGILTEHCDLDDSCDLDAYSFKGIFARNLRYLIDEEIRNGKTSHCNFTRLQVENARRIKSNFSDDVWYTEVESDQAVYFNICRQITTYKTFLERNIDAVISNASCVPKTSFNENMPHNFLNGIKEKENKSLTAPPKDDCHIVYLDGPPAFNKTGPVFGSAWFKPITEARPEGQVSVLELFTAGMHPNVSCVGKACTYDPPSPPPKHLTCQDNPCPIGQECCKYPETSSYTCCAPEQKCSQGYCE